MTAAETLTILEAQGVNVALIGGELEIDAPDEFITAEWRDWFVKAKAGLRAYLRQRSHFAELLATMPEADRYAIEERAAVYEYDGGFARDEAEAMAAREWQGHWSERQAA